MHKPKIANWAPYILLLLVVVFNTYRIESIVNDNDKLTHETCARQERVYPLWIEMIDSVAGPLSVPEDLKGDPAFEAQYEAANERRALLREHLLDSLGEKPVCE